MTRLLLLLPLLALLTNCQSLTPGARGSASSESASLAVVAGTWEFSHFGPATVSNSKVSNPGSYLAPYMRQMKISLMESGEAQVLAPGHAQKFRIRLIADTPLYMKIGVSKRSAREAFVYHKAERLLMMPSKLKIEGSKGILPTYFKKEAE